MSGQFSASVTSTHADVLACRVRTGGSRSGPTSAAIYTLREARLRTPVTANKAQTGGRAQSRELLS